MLDRETMFGYDSALRRSYYWVMIQPLGNARKPDVGEICSTPRLWFVGQTFNSGGRELSHLSRTCCREIIPHYSGIIFACKHVSSNDPSSFEAVVWALNSREKLHKIKTAWCCNYRAYFIDGIEEQFTSGRTRKHILSNTWRSHHSERRSRWFWTSESLILPWGSNLHAHIYNHYEIRHNECSMMMSPSLCIKLFSIQCIQLLESLSGRQQMDWLNDYVPMMMMTHPEASTLLYP